MQTLAIPKTLPSPHQHTRSGATPQATVKLERKAFVRALAMLAKITPKNPSMAAASSLHVTTSGHLVTLTATDFELTLTTHLPSLERSAHSPEIDMLIPCLELERVLKSDKGDFVLLEQFEGRAKIICERVAFEFPCAAPSGFPSPVPHGSPTLTLDAGQLSRALGRVLYANDSRTYGGLAGVLLELSQQRSRVVSSDGYRLALADFDAPNTLPATAKLKPAKYLIPTARARALERLFKTGELSIAVAHNYLVCSTETMRLTLRLHDKTFPDYAQIIPTASEFKLSADRASVLRAIKHLQTNYREAEILVLSIDASSMTMLLHDGDPSDHQIVVVDSNVQNAIMLKYHLARFTQAVASADERFDMAFSLEGTTIISNQSQTFMALVKPQQ